MGYFSQLARATGLTFEPGRGTVPRSVETTPSVRSPLAPLHIEAVSFTTPSETPSSLEETHDNVAAVAPPGGVVAKAHKATALNLPADVSGRAASDEAIAHRKNERAPTGLDASYEQVTKEIHTRRTNSERSADEPRSLIADERLAGRQQTIEFSEGSLNQTQDADAIGAAGTSSSIPFETSPLPETEARVRIRASEPGSAWRRTNSTAELSTANEQQVVEFSDESLPVAREFAPASLIEIVQQFEGQFVTPETGAETEVELLRPINRGAQSDPRPDDPREQEAIVRNYLKVVKAWVAEPPAIDERTTEQDDWEQALHKRRDVVSFDAARGLASTPRSDRREEPEVQDVSLSIGNVSIVIEEPKKDAPAATTAAPSVERSYERPAREPASLSRYYLRAW